MAGAEPEVRARAGALRGSIEGDDIEPAVATYPEDVSRRIWQHHTFSALPLLTPDGAAAPRG